MGIEQKVLMSFKIAHKMVLTVATINLRW